VLIGNLLATVSESVIASIFTEVFFRVILDYPEYKAKATPKKDGKNYQQTRNRITEDYDCQQRSENFKSHIGQNVCFPERLHGFLSFVLNLLAWYVNSAHDRLHTNSCLLVIRYFPSHSAL